ncbi:MAG: hypothetical protein M3Y37_05730, partial [Chloroflexota bacterium]|nr:hypothetical protein [Chloroflexota bacterium]
MRNLLGRLNARSAEDLTEIAEHWQTPLSGRDRLSRITQLYRAMTRPPMVRAQWDGLDSEEQRLVRVLIEAGDAGMTVDDVVEALGVNPDLTREMCLRLYEQGIVAYEGSARTLPIGESPRLFVPIELGNAVRRILREAQLGDISHYSLVELLALRSDQELFEAAAQWKIEFIPGVTTREQVTTLLNRAICNGAARRQQLAELGHEVRTVWERLTSVPQGTPVALDQILGSGNERTLFGRRNALDELEDRLLVWNMVTDDGSRALFIPRDLDSASLGAGQETPLPKAVSVVGLAVPYRPTAPIAWDLMVVLQRLFGPLAVPNVDPLAPGRTVLADLNQSFWNRGDDRPPVGYLEFLIELAVSLKLLEEPRDGASQFERTEEVREWRLRSWEEQSSQIRRIWMAAQYW